MANEFKKTKEKIESVEDIVYNSLMDSSIDPLPNSSSLPMDAKEDASSGNDIIDNDSKNAATENNNTSENVNTESNRNMDSGNGNIDTKIDISSEKRKDECSFVNSGSQDGNTCSTINSELPKSSRKRESVSSTIKSANKKFCNSHLKDSVKSKDISALTELTQEKVAERMETNQKNRENRDSNDIYMGILSDTIDTFPKAQDTTRQKLKRLNRKQLEDIILQQLVTTLIGDYKLGYQKDLCDRLEDSLEYATKKITQLYREIKDLKKVTSRLEGEHCRRRQELVNPVIIKRSVALQAEPCDIDQYYDAEISSEDAAYVDYIPRTEYTSSINGDHLDDYENYSDMDDRNCYESLLDGSDTEEIEDNYVEKISPNSIKVKSTAKIPRPTLTAKQKKKSIVLTWNTADSTCQNIASFRLFSCQNDKLKAKKKWRIIGDVEPMELPMACTLTDFNPGKTYHFSVRAINFKGEYGMMSKCDTVFMS